MENANQSRNLTGRFIHVLPLLIAGIAGYFLFNNLSERQTEIGLQIAYRSLSLNTVLVAAALAAGRLPAFFLSPAWEKRVTPAVLAISHLLAGFGVWRGMSAFSEEVPVLSGLGSSCMIAAVALAISHLAVYAQRNKFGGLFKGLFDWSVDSRSYFIMIALGIGVYTFIIRPLYIEEWTYSVLIEWVIISMLGILLLGIAYFRIERNFIVGVKSTTQDWRPHRQVREPKIDSFYTHIKRLESRFIDESDQTMLVHYLIGLLAQNDVAEHGIVTVLRPLIGYPETYTRNRAQRENTSGIIQRERLLNETVNEMRALVQPARYASRRSGYNESFPHMEAPNTVTVLAAAFCREGDNSLLLVRLSLLLASCATRYEYIEEILRLLLTHRSNPRTEQHKRERLWHNIEARLARYAPEISLKE